jgi:2-C-methyl-D-erythritol 2,4-cyclodiphosphate synthase
MDFKLGFGIDFHKLQKGKPLLLGGVKITTKFGAVGDSDADTILHSVCDAILSALGKGDLGTYFYKKKDIKSKEIANFIRSKFLQGKFQIKHLQTIVFLENPPLLDKKNSIRKSLSKIFHIKEENINIQAKTFQGLFSDIVLSVSFVLLE